MRLIQYLKGAFVAVSAAFVLVGATLLIWPDQSLTRLCALLGIICVLCGCIRLAGYFSNDLYRLAFQFDLAMGTLTILAGLLLLFRAEDMLVLLPVLSGALILVDSCLRLQTAIDAKHFGMRKWWIILAAAAGGALLGAVLLHQPLRSGRVLLRLMGATLILNGGENLLAGLYTIKVPRRSCPDFSPLGEDF